MLITMPVSTFVSAWYARWPETGRICKLNSFKLDPKHTYCIIFSKDQMEYLKAFKRKKVNILYESPKAVNRTPGHGELPRNILVIFEKKKVSHNDSAKEE